MPGHRCAYGVAGCSKRSCKPAELCPSGRIRVHRDRWTGGAHHHADDLEPHNEKEEDDDN